MRLPDFFAPGIRVSHGCDQADDGQQSRDQLALHVPSDAEPDEKQDGHDVQIEQVVVVRSRCGKDDQGHQKGGEQRQRRQFLPDLLKEPQRCRSGTDHERETDWVVADVACDKANRSQKRELGVRPAGKSGSEHGEHPPVAEHVDQRKHEETTSTGEDDEARGFFVVATNHQRKDARPRDEDCRRLCREGEHKEKGRESNPATAAGRRTKQHREAQNIQRTGQHVAADVGQRDVGGR